MQDVFNVLLIEVNQSGLQHALIRNRGTVTNLRRGGDGSLFFGNLDVVFELDSFLRRLKFIELFNMLAELVVFTTRHQPFFCQAITDRFDLLLRFDHDIEVLRINDAVFYQAFGEFNRNGFLLCNRVQGFELFEIIIHVGEHGFDLLVLSSVASRFSFFLRSIHRSFRVVHCSDCAGFHHGHITAQNALLHVLWIELELLLFCLDFGFHETPAVEHTQIQDSPAIAFLEDDVDLLEVGNGDSVKHRRIAGIGTNPLPHLQEEHVLWSIESVNRVLIKFDGATIKLTDRRQCFGDVHKQVLVALRLVSDTFHLHEHRLLHVVPCIVGTVDRTHVSVVLVRASIVDDDQGVVISNVCRSIKDTTKALVAHMEVAALSFTGSIDYPRLSEG